MRLHLFVCVRVRACSWRSDGAGPGAGPSSSSASSLPPMKPLQKFFGEGEGTFDDQSIEDWGAQSSSLVHPSVAALSTPLTSDVVLSPPRRLFPSSQPDKPTGGAGASASAGAANGSESGAMSGGSGGRRTTATSSRFDTRDGRVRSVCSFISPLAYPSNAS